MFVRLLIGKFLRKSLDEELYFLKFKLRKRSIESFREKIFSKLRKYFLDGKSILFKLNSDIIIKKLFIFFLRKVSDNKFVFSKSRFFFDGGVIEFLKINKLLSINKKKSFEGEIVIINDDDDGNKDKKSL